MLKLRAETKYTDLSVVILLFIIIAFYCFCIGSYSSSTLMSCHGLYHSAYVYQIMNGIIPPTNPQCAGATANVYWPWHFMLAILSKSFALSSLETGALINAFCFAVSTVLLYKLGRNVFSMSVFTAAIISVFAFCMLAYPYVFCGTLHMFVPEDMPVLSRLTDYKSLYMKILTAEPFIRGTRIVAKFTQQSSYASVVCLFCCGLYLDNRKNFHKNIKTIPVEFIVLLLAGLFNPIGLFVFDLWAVSVIIATFSIKHSGQWVKLFARRYCSLIAVNILLLPYVKYLSDSVGGELFIGVIPSRSMCLDGNVFLSFLWLIATVIILVKKKELWGPQLKCWYIYLTILLFAINLLNLPDKNEYKITQLAGLLAVFVFYQIVTPLISNKKNIKTGIRVILLLITINSMLFWVKCYRDRFPSDPLVFQGTQIRLNPDRSQQEFIVFNNHYDITSFTELQDMCDWIRENTAREAYIIKKPVHRNLMLEPVLAQRRLFVTLPGIQTQRAKNFQQLFDLNNEILDRIRKEGQFCVEKSSSNYDVIVKAAGSIDQLYVLVENSSLKAENRQFVVYQNKGYSLFRLSNMPD